MSRPFELWFPYCPKWKSNRSREKQDQLVVKLRDLPESRRVAEQERVYEELKAKAPEELIQTEPGQYIMKLSRARVELVRETVAKHLISFSPFAVVEADGNEREIKTLDEMWADCSDLVSELYARLLNGPDADELKN